MVNSPCSLVRTVVLDFFSVTVAFGKGTPSCDLTTPEKACWALTEKATRTTHSVTDSRISNRLVKSIIIDFGNTLKDELENKGYNIRGEIDFILIAVRLSKQEKVCPSGDKISVNKIFSVVRRSQKLVILSRLFFRVYK